MTDQQKQIANVERSELELRSEVPEGTATTGPFYADAWPGPNIYIVPESDGSLYLATIESGEDDPEGRYPPKAERFANAVLFAAAHEMRAVLVEVNTLIGLDRSVEKMEAEEIPLSLLKKMSAAIAKSQLGLAPAPDPETDDEKQQREYLERHGNRCPSCKEEDITYNSIEADGDVAWSRGHCPSCGSTWTDQYKLIGFDNLEQGDA